jgi:hypothetical protein
VQSKSKPLDFLLGFARNSPWLLTAVLLHVIVGFAMAVVYVKQHFEKEEKGTIHVAVSAAGRPAEAPVVQPREQIDRKAIPKDTEAELVTDEEVIYRPTDAVLEPQDLHLDVGDPNALDDLPPGATGGTGIGVGSGGHYGSGGPSAFVSREAGGGRRGRRTGATQATEESVLEGLRWLARHQNEDGSWGAETLATRCTSAPPCVTTDPALGSRFDAGMTGLALLAFLGQGISIDSKLEIVDSATGTRHSAGEIVKDGIKWLLARQRPDGSFSSNAAFEYPEDDTLPTMAVCEAYGLSRSRALKRPAQKALDFLIGAQKRRADGGRSGWGGGSYADLVRRRDLGELEIGAFEAASSVVDPTVTCWAVMAIQSARMCGLEVPEEVLAGALAYVVETTGDGKSEPSIAIDPDDEFVYHPARHRALGMLTRTFAGGPITDPYLELGARELAQDVPVVAKDGLTVDCYYWYFGTLALNQYDGPDSPRADKGRYWRKWNEGLVQSIISLQNDSDRRNDCARGGWLQRTRGNRLGMELRNTALNVLTLEVYYRFDNVFGMTKTAKAPQGDAGWSPAAKPRERPWRLAAPARASRRRRSPPRCPRDGCRRSIPPTDGLRGALHRAG